MELRGHYAVDVLDPDVPDAFVSRARALLAMGRPPVGAKRGPSPVVRARVPQALKDRVHDLAQREQRDESDIVRAALAAYIELRQAS